MKLKASPIALLFLFLLCSLQRKPNIRQAFGVSSKKIIRNELPFNFEVKETASKQQLDIMNGAERIKVTDIKYKNDSVFIHMPLFNSEFKLRSWDQFEGK